MGIQPPGLQPLFLPTLQQIWLGWLGSQPPFREPRSTTLASRTGSEVSRNRSWSSRRSRNAFSTPAGVILGWKSVRNVSKFDENHGERVYFSGIPKFSSKPRFQCSIRNGTVEFRLFLKRKRLGTREHFSWHGNFSFFGVGGSGRRPFESADPAVTRGLGVGVTEPNLLFEHRLSRVEPTRGEKTRIEGGG